MKKFTWFSLLGGTVLVIIAISLGLLLLRNYELDKGVRAYKEGNDAAATNTFRLLAKLGDQKAQYFMGLMYAFGQGVPKSDSDAIYWFKRAGMFAEKGVDPAAPAELGVAKSYAEGTDGVRVDNAESIKWLQLAAAGGSKEAAILLAEKRKESKK